MFSDFYCYLPGEGMAYDSKRDRFILGSLDFGTLLAVPRSTVPEKNIHYNAEGVTMLLNTRPEAFNGSNFLGLTMDPREGEDAVWGCISYGEYSTYGVARVNLTNNAVDFFDLTMLVRSQEEAKDHIYQTTLIYCISLPRSCCMYFDVCHMFMSVRFFVACVIACLFVAGQPCHWRQVGLERSGLLTGWPIYLYH